MFKKTENIAWLVLLSAFMMCVILTIGTPLSIRWYILNKMRPLDIRLQTRAGTVTHQKAGSNIKAVISGGTEVFRNDRIELPTNDASAFLLFYKDAPDAQAEAPAPPIITVEFNGDTEVILESAQTPSFAASQLPHRVILDIRRGANVRITVEGNERPTRLYIRTPHGDIEMKEGTYAVVVEAQRTEFGVTSGYAQIPDPATGESPVLTSMQRAELTAEGLGEIRVGDRDIMRNRNGDFESALEEYWDIEISAPPDESGGSVRRVPVSDNHIVLFERYGQQPAKTGIYQDISQDIRGAKSLRVRARVRVDTQTLGVCGSLATECPIMIKIYFADLETNSTYEWLQGFYAVPGSDSAFCHTCEWKTEQLQVPQAGAWYTYESEDLLPLFREQGIEPASVKSVNVYASGHAYGAAVDELAILVGE